MAPPAHSFIFTCPEQVARPPLGLEFVFKELPHLDIWDNSPLTNSCNNALEAAMATCNPNLREKVALDDVGVVFERSPFCHCLVRNNVCAVFVGEVAQWPGHDTVAEAHDAFMRGDPLPVHDDADWLLNFYDSFSGHAKVDDITAIALRSLSQVVGSFAFVVYDKVQRRVWAARDATGAQPLFWGVTGDNRLVFSTDPAKMDDCSPSATPFPAGTLYASHGPHAVSPGASGWVIQGDQQPGHLFSFVESCSPTARRQWRDIKAVPRLDETGAICGAVFRVASEQQLPTRINVA